jgi:O-antigen ligase/cytochrome c-type biogenesis protein CcmH/NrfG
MSGGSELKTAARWVALGALFLVPFTPLIVVNTFYFPFITGKGFYFRILIEVAVAAWAVLAVIDKAYRPRYSVIGVVVLAFLLWMGIADSFAVNAQKAFWSNFERMEGFVLLVHLVGFFFVASCVLRVEKKWRAWFLTSLSVGVVVSCYALFQLIDPTDFPIHQGSTRIDASFGNSAYLAIYLLFNVFIALWIALSEKSVGLRWSLITLAAVEGILILFTETRGTILGLAAALALTALLTALTAGKQARGWAAGGLIAIALVAGSFYLARDSSFVQNNHVLERIAGISLSEGQTRFQIWHMAWQGFLARPVTGWGQEGFNYVFNKYYDPALYGQEPWFDRAHNAFIDWLVAGGAPGFLLFVSLFASAIWLLWRRSELSRAERIALTGALVGYGIHNLFVFDNLYSYVYLFAILALIDSQVARPIRFFERTPALDSVGGITYALPVATILAVLAIWSVNIPGMTVSSRLITALNSSQDPAKGLTVLKDLAVHPAFAVQEVREQIVSYASTIAQNPNATSDQKLELAQLAVSEMEKHVALYPLDTRGYFELAYAYQAGGDIEHAITAMGEAIKLTPTKADAWITAGTLSWNAGDTSSAMESFDTAYSLAPQNKNLAAYAAAGAYAAGNAKKGDSILEDAFGTTTVDKQVLAVAYYRTQDWPRLIRLSRFQAESPSADAQTLFTLAGAYYESGDRTNAIETLRQAAARFPESAASVQAAIEQIQAKK